MSLSLIQLHNYVLAVAALATFVVGTDQARLSLLIVASAYAITSMFGWLKLFSEGTHKSGISYRELAWLDGLSIIGTETAFIVLVTLERLMIPKLLTLDVLAQYAVLAAVVGSAYRVLQLGASFTLEPRLRAAKTISDRRALLKSEISIISVAVLAGTIIVWFVSPWLVDLVTNGSYQLTHQLVAAGIFSGIGKVIAAIGRSAVIALGSSRDLVLLGVISWLSLCAGLVGALVGSSSGLTGIIYGVGAGWFFCSIMTIGLSVRHFREAHDG